MSVSEFFMNEISVLAKNFLNKLGITNPNKEQIDLLKRLVLIAIIGGDEYFSEIEKLMT